jgi:serine phosphatase RsbU (regulator of sigma subunit)
VSPETGIMENGQTVDDTTHANRTDVATPVALERLADDGRSATAFLQADLAAAKTSHYATRESGDTVELVERPDGGFTLVLVDGQGHGFPAKMLSLQLTARAVSLIKEGVRDGAVARAVHDYLHVYRGGRVSATLDLLSLDLGTNSVLVTRNAEVPGLVCREGEWEELGGASGPIGPRRHMRPTIDHFELVSGLKIVLYTDGIARAGERFGGTIDVRTIAQDAKSTTAQELVDALLSSAVAADRGKPHDDMSVIALTITERAEHDVVRRLSANIPLVQRRRDG